MVHSAIGNIEAATRIGYPHAALRKAQPEDLAVTGGAELDPAQLLHGRDIRRRVHAEQRLRGLDPLERQLARGLHRLDELEPYAAAYAQCLE
jgi:hypothetical protein